MGITLFYILTKDDLFYQGKSEKSCIENLQFQEFSENPEKAMLKRGLTIPE
jgi:hypothetical protein